MMSRILPILIGLIAIGIFFGYVHPTYRGDIAMKRAQASAYDSALKAAQAFKEREEELSKKQDAVSALDTERIEAFLPDGVDNIQLILDLDALSTRSGIRLQDFSVEQEGAADTTSTPAPGRLAITEERAVESIEVTVSGVGSYRAFRTFLEGVELSLRPLDLVDLSVSDSETGIYSYGMRFRIYWLR
jgi:hypothetical protein